MRRRLVVAVLLTFLIAWSISWALPTGELRDYGSFIASGRAGTHGLNPYGIYPLTFHVVLPGFDVWNPNLNPPISVPVFAQFDRIDPRTGFAAWWVLSLLCYLGAVLLLARTYARGRFVLVLWALALAGFWDTLALGQIYLPLVLATVASWILLDRGRPIPAGLLMGIVVAVKPNFALWPMLLVLAGHWRAPVAAVVTAAILSIIPLLTHGLDIYTQWIDLVLSDRGRAEFLTNASLVGLTSRAGSVLVGIGLSGVVCLGLSVWAVRRRPDVRQASAFGILTGILASPIAWVHYTLFLLPAFFTWPLSAPLFAAATLMLMPVPILLGYLDAPPWQQLTIGSAYNWAMLVALIGFSGARMRAAKRTSDGSQTVVFYDGLCGLCDRLVRFLLTHDPEGRLRFAPLQGAVAQRELVPAGHEPSDLNTVLVIADYGTPQQRVLPRSRAVLHALSQLGGVWSALATIGSFVPTSLADAVYGMVAKRRYRIFGRFDTCPLPRPEWRARFLDEPMSR